MRLLTRLKCFFGFHWKLIIDPTSKIDFAWNIKEPHYICGWCKKELENKL